MTIYPPNSQQSPPGMGILVVLYVVLQMSKDFSV